MIRRFALGLVAALVLMVMALPVSSLDFDSPVSYELIAVDLDVGVTAEVVFTNAIDNLFTVYEVRGLLPVDAVEVASDRLRWCDDCARESYIDHVPIRHLRITEA